MSSTNEVTSIAIIEDNHAIAEAFKFFIEDTNRYVVTGIYNSAEAGLEELEKKPVDLVLMDISLPGINGIEATHKLKASQPDINILIISVSVSPKHVFEALRWGASGYLTKNTEEEALIKALDQIVDGGAPMSAQIAKMVVSSFQVSRKSPLSVRETEVLELLSKGKSYTKIAKDLFVSGETVRSHIKNIYSKLHVNSKAEAIEKARKNRLV